MKSGVFKLFEVCPFNLLISWNFWFQLSNIQSIVQHTKNCSQAKETRTKTIKEKKIPVPNKAKRPPPKAA